LNPQPGKDLWIVRTVGLHPVVVATRPSLAQAELYVRNYKIRASHRKKNQVLEIEHYVAAAGVPQPPTIPRMLRDLANAIEAKAFEPEQASRGHDPPQDRP
jgi:hypothetical protein